MLPTKKPFFISAENKLLVEKIMESRKFGIPVNLLIRGKHGMGKSELTRQIAATYKMDYQPVPINLLQESGQLMGHDEFVEGQTRFIRSNFVQAITTPNTLVHLEELNRPESPKALGELFPLLDDSRAIRHDKLGEVAVAPGVLFVGTLNEGFEYSGIDPLDEALRDRFYQIELSYLPPTIESNIVVIRTGLIGEPVHELLHFVNQLRSDRQDPIHVSTRRVIMMCSLVAAGLSMRDAIVNCVGMDKDKLESILLKFDFAGQGQKATHGQNKDGFVLL